ncbi:AAA family ATPase [Persicimonas caeni]|uniref:AAA family ATPase n=1 Tax=Persicimonas caeni TaxID=2292766 RepID=A0A4Y6PUX4_PERCE|nr:RNA repair transcriptional activator RtcR family protein [Persicimonas caeni]QDG52053.1 AAA family ATPase [Persicimonas caeni]QED33274.1 AAA family ATPase [Persicimonas caeni]
MKILVCWIGFTDIRASQGKANGIGPIAQAFETFDFDRAVLLCDSDDAQGQRYREWVAPRTSAEIDLRTEIDLDSPMDFEGIYRAATDALEDVLSESTDDAKPDLTFHVSPGTPVMAAVWIILAKTRFPATVIQSSKDHGAQVLPVPFHLSAEYIADLTRHADERLVEAAQAPTPEDPAFESIIHQCGKMQELLRRARLIAPRHVPVLIQGESGTGKELLAKAIHHASPRKDGPFVAVNCGAIPPNLVEAEFFGAVAGAYTGSKVDRTGHFEEADGGTIFLDEIGEMPLEIQVKVLRVLQERKVMRVGSSDEIDINVRVVAATNRSLFREVNEGRFREDLFHRIAVGILDIPPLRERSGDLDPLVNAILADINDEFGGSDPKELSTPARKAFHRHHWPGNIRELRNTLLRAYIMTSGPRLSGEMVESSLLTFEPGQQELLHRPLDDEFDLEDILNEVKRHYIQRALAETDGVKKRATELLGLGTRQTLSNWMDKLGVDA